MPPGHPIILLKSNRMAAVSVKRPEKVYSKVWFFVIAPNKSFLFVVLLVAFNHAIKEAIEGRNHRSRQ